MKATKLLHNLGQSLWLDNITRDLLNTGTLKRYIDELGEGVKNWARFSCATDYSRIGKCRGTKAFPRQFDQQPDPVTEK